MTSLNNTTTNDDDENKYHFLWLPHVLIAVGFVTFLVLNFLLHHRKNRERYQRKAEALETKQRMQERRRVLNIVRLRYLPSISNRHYVSSDFRFRYTTDNTNS
ncbi:Hypothetical predicted protein, partial [Mytilus galloprovincialis]